ncbi:MAG: sodium-dependent transporter, partial [Bacteroidales bacterium]|nr:sodium-dependent transporter [Bacteroidales bacterium]
MSEQRGFSSSFGAIMAAVGSAVGLGNIWRFPYITGKYGGGAFLLVYIIFVFFLGRLLMLSEFVIGRRSQHGPLKAYTSLCPKQKWWKGLGLLSLITVFLILGQYAVVSGWTCNYVWDSVTGVLTTLSPDEVTQHFTDFSTGTWAPIVCLLVFLALTALVVLGGVEKGIEAVSKLLMPLLIVLVLALGVRSVTLPGASEGLAYLFKPDFSKLTSEGILA